MIDLTLWNSLLNLYVDDRGRVNYQAWQAESATEFYQWLSELAQLTEFPAKSTEERLALWLNLYNAFTIATVVERYPISSIRPTILGIPNWIAFGWFFVRPVHPLAGKRYSLNQIEHKILRIQFKEPRIHFALVCASVGCPLLRSEAYFPETVETQLAEDRDRFINNPDKVRYDGARETLYLSKIFQWYGEDFCKVAPSVVDYLRPYLKTDTPLPAKPKIAYLPYDWSLNRQ